MKSRSLELLAICVLLLTANWLVVNWLPGRARTANPIIAQEQGANMAEAAAAQTTFNYQGLLRNPDGSLMTGAHTIKARIYDVATGGTSLFEETFANVTVRDGLFNIVLGDSPGTDPSTVLTTQPRYIGISLDGQSELIPRQRLHAVPWAIYATKADNADKATKAQTIVANASTEGNLTINGDLAWSGALSSMRVSNSFEISHINDPGVDWKRIEMVPVQHSICFLVEVKFRGTDINSSDNWGACSIDKSDDGSKWRLSALAEHDQEAFCRATCLQWNH